MSEDKYGIDDFTLYQVARAFRVKIYKLARELPTEEKFNLTSQIRRAALSITNNIAEGHGRWFYLDNARFCRFAHGSLEEVIDDLNACIDEQYFPLARIEELKLEAQNLIRRLNSYIGHLKRTKQGQELPDA